MACPTDSRQQPLFAVRRFLPRPYKTGSFFDVLERFGSLIIKAEDFPRASHEAGGVPGFCVVLKSKLVLIQRKHGWSDEETVLRARTDLGVKACLGLGVEQEGPSQPTLCRHRQRMQELKLDQVYMQRFVALLQTLELVTPREAVLVDSVPVDGAGQVQDSYNLLAGAVRHGLRRLGACTGETVAQVSKRLDLERYVERGIKGKFPVDWETKEGPRQLLAQLVADAQRLQAQIGHYFSAPPTAQAVAETRTAPAPSSPAAAPEPAVESTEAQDPQDEPAPCGTAPPAAPCAPQPTAAPAAAPWESPAASAPAAGGVPPAVVPAATPWETDAVLAPAPCVPPAPASCSGSCPPGPGTGPSDASPPPAAVQVSPSVAPQAPPTGDLSPAQQALVQASLQLTEIVAHDVEFAANGQVVGIRQQAAGDRPISVTDPQMRHGRKSASVLIAGYKAQVVASLLGFILLLKVFRANQHDGENVPQLREALHRLKLFPHAMIGDHAYGTLANHAAARRDELGLVMELIARMARPSNGGRFTKDQFVIDFDQRTLTCPAGQLLPVTRLARRDKERGWEFAYPAALCGACPHNKSCVSPAAKGKGRTVFLVPDKEKLIRHHLQRRQEQDFVDLLALRPLVERVIAGFAQCGGKQAHRMGQDNVSFDATLSALAYNLRRLGGVLRDQPAVAARLEAAARRLLFLCLVLALLRRRAWSRCLACR